MVFEKCKFYIIKYHVRAWFFFNYKVFLIFAKFVFHVGPIETRTGELITQEDTIFISGMNPRTTEGEIKQHFGAIGLIKVKLCYDFILDSTRQLFC